MKSYMVMGLRHVSEMVAIKVKVDVIMKTFWRPNRWSSNINKNKSLSGRSKSRGRSKSPGKPIEVCWKCRKEGHLGV